MVNKSNIGHVVVSSTIYQCMGSGCPIVALESDFTFRFNDAIITFTNMEEFVSGIKSIFDENERYKTIKNEREEFIKDNSATAVARMFIELFENLK